MNGSQMYLKRKHPQLNVMIMMEIKTLRIKSSNIPISYISVLQRLIKNTIKADNTVRTVLSGLQIVFLHGLE